MPHLIVTRKLHWYWFVYTIHRCKDRLALISSFFCVLSSWWSHCIHVMHRPCGAHRIRAANQPIRESLPWISWLRSRTLLISQTSTASSLYVVHVTTQKKHIQTQKYSIYSVMYIECNSTLKLYCVFVHMCFWAYAFLCILVHVEDPPGAPALPGGQGKFYWLRPHPYPGQWAEGKQERDPDQQLQIHLQPSGLFLHQRGAREGFPLPTGINNITLHRCNL